MYEIAKRVALIIKAQQEQQELFNGHPYVPTLPGVAEILEPHGLEGEPTIRWDNDKERYEFNIQTYTFEEVDQEDLEDDEGVDVTAIVDALKRLPTVDAESVEYECHNRNYIVFYGDFEDVYPNPTAPQ